MYIDILKLIILINLILAIFNIKNIKIDTEAFNKYLNIPNSNLANTEVINTETINNKQDFLEMGKEIKELLNNKNRENLTEEERGKINEKINNYISSISSSNINLRNAGSNERIKDRRKEI